MSKIKKIDMNSDTFSKLKNDMTFLMNKLLNNMEAYGAEEAAMSVKINVKLEDTADGKIPVIKHKIATGVQIKDERENKIGGDCTLEKDDKGMYQLHFFVDQADMFEEAVE